MSQKGRKIDRVCCTCRKQFLAAATEVKRRGGKYCSRKCYYASIPISLEDQFRRGVGLPNEAGCILWTGTLDKSGRGIIYSTCRPPQRLFQAHRLAWEFANGHIPEGMCVCHKCDVPACVNVEHLFLGTQLDNIRDMERKGRQANRRLSDDAIRTIRARYAASGVSQQQLADEYGVNQTCISSIVRGAKWKYVT